MKLDMRSALVALIVVAAMGRSLSAVEKASVTGKAVVSSQAPSISAGQRQREGSFLVDVPGHFKLTSDRATFYPTGSEQRYLGLENLNLERIALVVGENPEQLEWIVSGAVTEYRGANYLLITKSLLKNKLDAPARTDLPPAAPSRPAAR
jgi:hypothetical protein